MVERRQSKRYELESGPFASLSLRLTVLGKVFNISERGLAFSYVASQKRSGESPCLDLVLMDGRQRLRNLPFRTVWDKPMFQEFSNGTISIRHCGVAFNGLTEAQQSDLKKLIASCVQCDHHAS
jgi:hypothetical protein